MKAQGFDLTKNAYNNKWQPYVAYWGCAWTMFFILINGFAVFFGKFDVSGFFVACESCTCNAPQYAHTKATRYQYSNFRHFVCWIQDCEEDQDLEAFGNGLCYCTTFPFLVDLRCSVFLSRAFLLWKRPRPLKSRPRIFGSALLEFFSRNLCICPSCSQLLYYIHRVLTRHMT